MMHLNPSAKTGELKVTALKEMAKLKRLAHWQVMLVDDLPENISAAKQAGFTVWQVESYADFYDLDHFLQALSKN